MNMNNDLKMNNVKKKNKNSKPSLITSLYKKISYLMNQIDFLFKNKFIYHEFYMDKMDLLNNIHIKINNYEELIDKKKTNKINLDNLLNDINLSFEKVCNKIGCSFSKIKIQLLKIPGFPSRVRIH